MQSAVKPRGIYTINGPVSVSIHTSQKKSIFIFGDAHGSKTGGCEGPTISMNSSRSNVTGLGATNIDIDSLFHIWCLHNAKENVPTTVLYERPLSRRELPGEKEAGWMYDVSSLFKSADIRTASLKKCVYSPSVQAYSADIRYGEQGTQDLFTWAQEVIVASEVSTTAAKNAINLSRLLIDNYESILQAYTSELGMQELKVLREKIATADIGSLKKQTLEVLDSIPTSGSMCRIASSISAARKRDNTGVELLLKHVRDQVALNIMQAKESMSETTLLATFLALADRDREEAMCAYHELGATLSDAFLYIGALVMDLYLLSSALASSSREVLIYVGARHALTYSEILFQHPEYERVKQILPNVYSDRVLRYVSDVDLISSLTIGSKINVLYRGKPNYLDSAASKIADYNLNY